MSVFRSLSAAVDKRREPCLRQAGKRLDLYQVEVDPNFFARRKKNPPACGRQATADGLCENKTLRN